MKGFFKKHLALPQDHGAWVFILSPLLIGIFAGGMFSPATLLLAIAAMAAFMLRQPLTIAVKAYSGRRPKTDLPPAWFWISVYGLTTGAALAGLVLAGFGTILWLAVPGAPVFAWHLWLVTRRAERRQPGIEVIATGVLSLTAPAAYWVGVNGYNPTGWWLWLFTWLQSAASIVYAYLRLGQREIGQEEASTMRRRDWQRLGRRAFLYTSFNLLFSLAAGLLELVPVFLFIPFLVQWLESLWGIHHPAVGWKATRIGIRQLIVSITWTVLFILLWG